MEPVDEVGGGMDGVAFWRALQGEQEKLLATEWGDSRCGGMG